MTPTLSEPFSNNVSSRAARAVDQRAQPLSHRVVVTAVGVSTPRFADADAFLKTIGSDMQKPEAADGSRSSVAVPRTPFSEQKFAKFQDDTAKWALAATFEAISAAGLDSRDGATEIGLALGTCFGPLRWGLNNVYRSAVIDPVNPRVSCFSSVIGYFGSAIGNVTIPMGFHGPSLLFSNMDDSAADAIAYAYKTVESGRCSVMVCGGADAPVPEMWRHKNDTSKAGMDCRGEGASILVLETLEHALRRGACVLAELCGYRTGAKGAGSPAAESLVAGKGLRLAQVMAVVADQEDLRGWREDDARSPRKWSRRYMSDVAEMFGQGSAMTAAAGAVAAVKIAQSGATGMRGAAPGGAADEDDREFPACSEAEYVVQCSSGRRGHTSVLLFRRGPAVSD